MHKTSILYVKYILIKTKKVYKYIVTPGCRGVHRVEVEVK